MPFKDPKRKAAYHKKYHKAWYAKNRKAHIARVKKAHPARVKKAREAVIAYLRNHPCVDCGETDIVVLEFDHVSGQKRENISDMLLSGFSIATIMKEIAKCDVVCANDHRRRTAKRGKFYKVGAR